FYFPEIVLTPNIGQAGRQVNISATDFPSGANVTSLRFAGMELPFPANTTADGNGDFNLVFNVPKTMWSANITSGWYDVEVEARKGNEPSVFIMKPFQVTTDDVAFTMKAEPDWLPPIPPSGSTTTIRVTSMGSAADVTLSVERIPPGISTAFSVSQVNVPPRGSGSSILTLTPTTIPPGHYGAEIKGTATVSGVQKTFFAHIEFDVQPPMMFMDTSWMEQQGIWFPEITLNPTAGPVKGQVTIKATDFPAGANITSLRFAGRPLPVPANTVADSDGNANLVFNVPSDFGVGMYMVEVVASKSGMPPVFIAKPFFIEDAGVTFMLNVVPGFIPGVPQGNSGNTTIFVESTSQAVTVQLYVDGLPSGVTGSFDNVTISVPPRGSGTTKLTITTGASTPPGHYPLTIRGVSGGDTRMVPFGLGVTPPANFQVPEFSLEPDYAPAGYTDKKYKVTFSGTGFPANQSVTSLDFGSQSVAIPDNLTSDANGNFNGVFQMPTGLDPGIYDVRVAVATGDGGYLYDSRPFSIRGSDAKFILKLSPPYLPPIVQGGQGTITVNTRSVGTTTANVTLYVDGLAPGITASFSPSNFVTVAPGGSGSATLTLSVTTATPPGPYPVSIRGVSGSEAAVVPLGFGVMPNIGAGEGHATITINPPRARPGEHIGISGAGFTSGNTITLTAAPPGMPIPIDITPGTIQVETDGTWASEVTVPEAGQVPPGTYIIKASDGTMASKNTFSIVPSENADFFLNVSPPFIEVVQGASGNTTMTLSSRNGFNERVVFSVGHLAPGVTATFKGAAGNIISKFTGTPGGIREVAAPTELIPIPGEDLTVTILIEVDSGAPIGPYDIALEAGSGTVYRAIPLGLMVASPGASMIISPMSGPADTDIRLSGSGFAAGETVTVTFAGNSITTVPATITAAQDGSFTAVITAPSLTAGIHPVSVSGATSGITIDRPFGLKPSAVNSFVLYASPQKVDIPKGGSTTITAKIEPLGSFQSPVNLSVSGLGTIVGATANISPSSTVTPSIATPTTATLTINVPAGASVGRYPLTITGTSGAITQTRNITVNVVPPAGTPDFGISLAPNTVPISPSSTGNTTITVAAINGFSGTVNLAVAMSAPAATWPSGITYTAGSITPSATTGLGKQPVTFTIASGTQPGNWTFKITGTSGVLAHSAEVMVICTPSGTTVTSYASPRLDPTTITTSTPMAMTPPWGDKITITGIINDGSEASVITPAKMDVPPDTLASLPEGASDMLGRITNVESSSPVDGVQWNIGFPFDSANLTAAGFNETNLKVAYLNPETGTWTEVTTTIDTTNKVAYASSTHFSSWTLIATPTPPPSVVVTEFSGGGGGGAYIPAGDIKVGDGFSGVSEISLSFSGKVIEDCLIETAGGGASLEIPRLTKPTDADGNTLKSFSASLVNSPPAPPPQQSIMSAHDFGPDGARFEPAIILNMSYDPEELPEGVEPKEILYIAYWDGSQWLSLDSTVDTRENTVSVLVEHFTQFALISKVSIPELETALAPEVEPEVETVPASAAEPAPAPELEPETALAPVEEPEVEVAPTPAVEPAAAPEPGTAPVTEPTQPVAPFNWGLIGGIIAAVAIIGVVIWRVAIRRKAS
ncbi:MAG TPA: hypothetical protein VMW00_04625, partial [Dehalococcoidales bacterium]|nr:hypothetical protein [Dehalococcoidales bacterium]